MKYVAVVLAALIVLVGTQSLGRAEPTPAVQRWEYRLIAVVGPGSLASPESLKDPKIDRDAKALTTAFAEHIKKLGYEVVDPGEFRKFLTDAGAAGWEIVSAGEAEWIFKRPLK